MRIWGTKRRSKCDYQNCRQSLCLYCGLIEQNPSLVVVVVVVLVEVVVVGYIGEFSRIGREPFAPRLFETYSQTFLSARRFFALALFEFLRRRRDVCADVYRETERLLPFISNELQTRALIRCISYVYNRVIKIYSRVCTWGFFFYYVESVAIGESI